MVICFFKTFEKLFGQYFEYLTETPVKLAKGTAYKNLTRQAQIL